MLRAYHVQTRCPRSALQGRLAAAYVSDRSELPLSENPQTENTIFAASLLPSTPLRAVKFGDAPLYDAVNARAMTLLVFDLRTRRPRNAVPGRLAPSYAVSAHSASLNFQ
jgi:hypothetical protein